MYSLVFIQAQDYRHEAYDVIYTGNNAIVKHCKSVVHFEFRSLPFLKFNKTCVLCKRIKFKLRTTILWGE